MITEEERQRMVDAGFSASAISGYVNEKRKEALDAGFSVAVVADFEKSLNPAPQEPQWASAHNPDPAQPEMARAHAPSPLETDSDFPEPPMDVETGLNIKDITAKIGKTSAATAGIIPDLPDFAGWSLAKIVNGAIQALGEAPRPIYGPLGLEFVSPSERGDDKRLIGTLGSPIGEMGARSYGLAAREQEKIRAAHVDSGFAGEVVLGITDMMLMSTAAIIMGRVSPALGIATFGGSAFGNKYGSNRGAGLPPGAALLNAAGDAGIEMATESWSFGYLTKKFPDLKGNLFDFFSKEMGGEWAATLLGKFNDRIELEPNKPWPVFLDELLQEEIMTTAVTALGVPLQAGVAKGLAKALKQPRTNAEAVGMALQDVVDKPTFRPGSAEQQARESFSPDSPNNIQMRANTSTDFMAAPATGEVNISLAPEDSDYTGAESNLPDDLVGASEVSPEDAGRVAARVLTDTVGDETIDDLIQQAPGLEASRVELDRADQNRSVLINAQFVQAMPVVNALSSDASTSTSTEVSAPSGEDQQQAQWVAEQPLGQYLGPVSVAGGVVTIHGGLLAGEKIPLEIDEVGQAIDDAFDFAVREKLTEYRDEISLLGLESGATDGVLAALKEGSDAGASAGENNGAAAPGGEVRTAGNSDTASAVDGNIQGGEFAAGNEAGSAEEGSGRAGEVGGEGPLFSKTMPYQDTSEGGLVITDFDAIPWGRVNLYMKGKGYDVRGADDARRIFEKANKWEGGMDGNHAAAIRSVIGARQKSAETRNNESNKIITAAVREFGITTDPKEAGYLLPDGRMLDFSGKRDGGSPGQRSYDHREINRAYEPEGDDHSSAMFEFASKTGAVRMDYNNRGYLNVDIYSHPTKKQVAVLKSLITQDTEVNLDISSVTGSVIDTYEGTGQQARAKIEGVIRRNFPDVASANLFSTGQPTGNTIDNVIKELSTLLTPGALGNKARLEVVQSVSQLPEHIGKFLKMVAWHGSPHRHDKFSTEKIGSGEGAQAYGWGLYYASQKEIAEYYKNTLSISDGAQILEDGRNSFSVWGRKSKSDAQISMLAEGLLYGKAVDFKREWDKNNTGALYQVELAPAEEDYLLWDRPLSEQSEKVKKALAEAISSHADEVQQDMMKHMQDGNATGGAFYGTLASMFGYDNNGDKPASEYLHSLGIRGIKYLDGTSRSKGEGNFNFVIFSDEDVSIQAIYSKDGSIAGAFDPKSGKIWLVSDTIKPGDAAGIYRHEVTHRAMREDRVFSARYDSLLSEFAALRESDPRIATAFSRVPSDTRAELVAEEALAYLVQGQRRGEAQGWGKAREVVRKIVAHIRAWLSTHGFKLKLTTDDILAMIDQGIKRDIRRSEQGAADHSEDVRGMVPAFAKQFGISIEEAQRQYDEVVAKYRDTDQWMKAPNGQPTKLNERQWVQTRTDAFSGWFGDWQNDPKNASQVVDENGEPLVVYHGSPEADFAEFKIVDMGGNTFHENTAGTAFFVSDVGVADIFTKTGFTGHTRLGKAAGTFPVFLNIRKPETITAADFSQSTFAEEEYNKAFNAAMDDAEEALGEKVYFYDGQVENELDGASEEALAAIDRLSDVAHNGVDPFRKTREEWQEYYNNLKAEGKDGVIISSDEDLGNSQPEFGADNYAVFNPNQIKSSLSNSGAFNPASADIRYAKDTGPLFSKSEEVQQSVAEGQDVPMAEVMPFISEPWAAEYLLENAENPPLPTYDEARELAPKILEVKPEEIDSYFKLVAESGRRALLATEQKFAKMEKASLTRARRLAKDAAEDDIIHAAMAEAVGRGGLNLTAVRDTWGKDTVRVLLLKRPGLLTDHPGAVMPDEFADEKGFAGDDAMIQAFVDSPTKKELFERLTETFVAEENSVINPVFDELFQEELLAQELGIINAMLGKSRPANKGWKKVIRENTGQLKQSAMIPARDALRHEMKLLERETRNAFREGQKDAKGKGAIWQKLKDEQARAAKATMREKLATLVARKQEVFDRYKERAATIRERERIRRGLKRLAKSPTITLAYRDQFNALMNRYGLGRFALNENAPKLGDFIQQEKEAGEDVMVLEALQNQLPETGLSDMTRDDLSTLWTFLKVLHHIGMIKGKVLGAAEDATIEGQAMEIATSAYKLRARSNLGRGFTEAVGKKAGLTLNMQRSLARLAAEGEKIEFITQHLDRWERFGPAWSGLYLPASEAENEKLRLFGQLHDQIQAAFKPFGGGFITNKASAWANTLHNFTVESGKDLVLRKETMVMIALNSGNEGNRAALRAGYAFAEGGTELTDNDIDRIVSQLSPAERRLVEQVWDIIDSLWEPLNDAHIKLYGIRMGRVEGRYFPLFWDRSLSSAAGEVSALQETQDLLAQLMPSTSVRNGMTKTRVGGKLPVLLEFGVILRHIEDATHLISHGIPVRNIQRLIKNPMVKASIEQTLGPAVYSQFIGDGARKGWLNYIARPQRPIEGELLSMAGRMRRATTTSLLAWKLSTAALQLSSLPASVYHSGGWLTIKSAGKFYARPGQYSGMVDGKSIQVATRRYNKFQEFREMVDNWNPNAPPALVSGMKTTFFWAYQIFDAMVVYPTWMAAYEQQMGEDPANEMKAIQHADSIIRGTQPTGMPKDMSRWQSGGEGSSILYMFASWANVAYNVQLRMGQRLYEGMGAGDFLKSLLWQFMAPAFLAVLVRLRGRLPSFEEYLAELGAMMAQGLPPYAKELAGALISGHDYQLSPIAGAGQATLGLIKSAGQGVLDDETDSWSITKKAIAASGYYYPWPSSQVLTTIKGLEAIAGGDDDLGQLIMRPAPEPED